MIRECELEMRQEGARKDKSMQDDMRGDTGMIIDESRNRTDQMYENTVRRDETRQDPGHAIARRTNVNRGK